ncbi:MAG: hypothetical protein A4S09_08325 [Proteobacteria bacterium SG_bin7]|nr:MAG: hypothetical protein A4S09_08325 [Proteobacteria bacterium SG_bin7]
MRRLNFRTITNQKGVALLMAMASLLMMTFIAVEVQYGTQVEALSANQAINRLKAYYSAKAGVELSLYRILTYRKANSQFGKLLGENSQLLDKIWQIPLSWPITIPNNVAKVNKDQFDKVLKESSFDGKYVTTIESEESKIDINDLGSKAKVVRDAAKQKILNIFQQKIKNDESFRDKYDSYNFETLINNITDWIDEDTTGVTSGDERSLYSDIKETDKLPPNQPFKTIQELHLVASMEDALYDVIAPLLTVYGSGAINVNQASKEVLMSLDPLITEDMVAKVIERRGNPALGGPFKNADDFYGFLDQQGLRAADLKQKNFPLDFSKSVNFRITSLGNAKNIARKIVAIVYDFDQVKDRLKGQLTTEAAGGNPTNSTPGNPPNNGAPASPTPGTDAPKMQMGRPTVVYWFEN